MSANTSPLLGSSQRDSRLTGWILCIGAANVIGAGYILWRQEGMVDARP